jgi:hypothetical protein
MSDRSTGQDEVTVTVPEAMSTETESTPGTAEISAVTARSQWPQVMPVTVNVVEPMNVRGVLDNMGTPRGRGGASDVNQDSADRGSVSPGKSPGFLAEGRGARGGWRRLVLTSGRQIPGVLRFRRSR